MSQDKPRQVIQMAPYMIYFEGHPVQTAILALCNDGTLWASEQKGSGSSEEGLAMNWVAVSTPPEF